MSTPKTVRTAWHEFFRDHPAAGQQFGTTDDESTYNGATGCTHTLMRMLIRAKTGRDYTHDELSKMIGYPWPAGNPGRRGMRWTDGELLKLVRLFDLPYTLWVHDGPLTAAAWSKFKANLDEAPVMAAIKYSHYPEWRGYVYNGQKADGWPNGYAISNGKTQLSGAESIAHAVLFVAWWRSAATGRYVFTVKDPNHGSTSRPERPPFDRITPTQTQALLTSIRQLQLGNEPRPMTFLIPARSWRPKGY